MISQADCVHGAYERPLGAATEETALVLTAVHTGGKNTEEKDPTGI